MSRRSWARLTALRDVVVAMDDGGGDVRAWLFAYHPGLAACPYQRIASDDFAAVLRVVTRRIEGSHGMIHDEVLSLTPRNSRSEGHQRLKGGRS